MNHTDLPKRDIQEMDEILQSCFKEFRQAVGLPPDTLSERAKEYFRKAMHDYAQRKLMGFTNHLNTYEGMEEARFDFMLVDFNNGVDLKEHHEL